MVANVIIVVPIYHSSVRRDEVRFRNEVSATMKGMESSGVRETRDGYPIGMSKVKELSRRKLGYRGRSVSGESYFQLAIFLVPHRGSTFLCRITARVSPCYPTRSLNLHNFGQFVTISAFQLFWDRWFQTDLTPRNTRYPIFASDPLGMIPILYLVSKYKFSCAIDSLCILQSPAITILALFKIIGR